jgi:phospholipid transport system transporter-binding protein
MIGHDNLQLKDNCLHVAGALNFNSVMSVYQQSLPLIAARPALHIDLSGVTSANSAGLALLIEWMKYAKSTRKEIQFKHIPESLLSMAKVAGVDKII